MSELKRFDVDVSLCVFVSCLLALSFAGHGTFVDENLIIQTLDSLTTDGSLTVTKMFQALEAPDGKYYSRYGIGFPLILLPFYGTGCLLDAVFPETYAFYGNAPFFMMLWGSVLFTVMTAWIFFRLCLLLGANARSGVFLSLALIFATPFWPYSQTLFRLTAAGLILVLVLYAVLAYRRNAQTRTLFAIAALTALGLNLREDLVFGLCAIGLYILLRFDRGKRWKCALTLITGAVAGTSIWGAHNYIRFGTFFIENYKDLTFDYPLVLSLPQLLVGLRRGLLMYAPIALLLPLSYRAARRRNGLDLWFLCAAVMGMYMILYGKSDMWHGGQCWGPRHLYFLLPFCLLPAAWLFQDHSKLGLKCFSILAFAWGLIVNAPGVYAHQGRYQDFFSSPSIWPLLSGPVVHPEYITFDELDLWWIRMIKMNPWSLWPVVFVGLIALTIYSGYRLWLAVHLSSGRSVNMESD